MLDSGGRFRTLRPARFARPAGRMPRIEKTPKVTECLMAGETDLHKLLKKEACRWLYRVGYRCIAAEVRLPPLGIIDSVGTGLFAPNHNYLFVPQAVHQTCFIECKASRADFLRDVSEDGQLSLALMERAGNTKRKKRRRRRTLSQRVGLGKFDACLAQPMANIHYILAPAGMIARKELPPRWGLLSFGDTGVNVVVRPDWQEAARGEYVECSIARTLTMDIYRADDRAMASVNRQIMTAQASLAEKIRQMRIVTEGEAEIGMPDIDPTPAVAPAPEAVGRGIPTSRAGLAFRKNRVALRR